MIFLHIFLLSSIFSSTNYVIAADQKIHNNISSETDDEFITRTQKLDAVPFGLWEKYSTPYRPEMGMLPSRSAYSPNKNEIIVYERVWSNGANSSIFVVDVKKNELVHKRLWSQPDIENIALSSNASMFAYVQGHKLTIENVKQGHTTDELNTIKLPKYCTCHKYSAPAFNKQNTHIIVHYSKVDDVQQDPLCTISKLYTIFPVQNS